LAPKESGYTATMSETIALYGGTFDPPHIAHLILAAEAQNQLALPRLLWLPAPQPPHKTGLLIMPLHHRLAMLRRAIAGLPGFEISNVEMERPGPHYTIETLEILGEKFPAADFVLLIGGDSLRDFLLWRQPHQIVAACRFIGVMRRPGDSVSLGELEEKIPGISQKVRFVNAPQLEISSGEIRRRIAAGEHYRHYLPPGVYEYIEEHKLYR
jgi:nicotinate-nucleotide adenylyltransferase